MLQILLEIQWRPSLKLVHGAHLAHNYLLCYHMTLQRALSCLIPHSVWALPHCEQLPSLCILGFYLRIFVHEKLCVPKNYIFNMLISQGYILQPLTVEKHEKYRGKKPQTPQEKENCLHSFIYLSHFRMQTVKSRSPWMHYKALTAIFYNLLISMYIFVVCVKLWQMFP